MTVFPTSVDMYEALAGLDLAQRRDIERWYNDALWYAWGRIDAGELDSDIGRGWAFALVVAAYRFDFISESITNHPGMLALWNQYADSIKSAI